MPARKTHEQYIMDCKIKEIDIPTDRENNRYVGDKVGLFHTCSKGHPDYLMTPKRHLAGQGCSICGLKSRIASRTRTHDQYCKECDERGVDPPVDSKDNRYLKSTSKLWHRCRKDNSHPDYLQVPHVHLAGRGCIACARNRTAMKNTKTHDRYIAECKRKNLDTPIDVINNRYIDCNTKLWYSCKSDHIYLRDPSRHLRGAKCQKCSLSTLAVLITKTHEQYCTECEINGFDLPIDEENNRYVNNHTKLLHICGKGHPPYSQAPTHHSRGIGCPICGIELRSINVTKTHDEHYRECENRLIDLPFDSEDNLYLGDKIKLLYVCRKGHPPYLQSPSDHLQGCGCPNCRNKTEGMLLMFLLSLGYTVLGQQSFSWTLDRTGKYRKRKFDFYIPSLKLLVELDGPHHFGFVGYSRIPHIEQLSIDTYEKMVPALRNGFSILRISQPDLWNDRDGLIKDCIKRALEQHKPDERAILTVARNLSIYHEHLNLTEIYYNDPNMLPKDETEDDSEETTDTEEE